MKTKLTDVRAYTAFALSLTLSLAVAVMISCGGSTSSSSNPTTGTVKTYLSDPPTCSLEFNHVWVTITKVEANISATSNSGWQTLVDLTKTPQQVDLLALNPSKTTNFCGTLYLLGSSPLPPGKYQQIRLTLLANNASSGPSTNACGSAGFNCVVPRNPIDGSDESPAELQLSSQAQTGIKITTSQMPNGGLTVTAGQSTDFDIDFNTCASILKQGNGQYRFKPVLHGGEVSTMTNSISGKVVEGTGSPNPGMGIPNAFVLLEQPDSSTPPTDRVIAKGLTNPDGTFEFCPLAPTSSGNKFDVVVAGTTTQTVATVQTTTTYNPSVVFGVPIGGSTASIPLFPENDSTGGLVSPGGATIGGQITTQGAGSTPVAGDVQLSALQTVSNGSSNVNLTIPVLDKSSTPDNKVTDSQPPVYTTVTTTSAGGGCATSELDCVGYSVTVPASAVAVGTYDITNGNNVAPPSSNSQAMYTIEGLADGTDGLLNCTSPATSDQITVKPGDSVDQTTTGTGFSSLVLGLTGCTVPSP